MIRQLVATLLIATGLTGAQAQSTYPEDGWWWDPDASGRGYLIERQADRMFVVSMHYSETGASAWLWASGEYEAIDQAGLIGQFDGTVYENSQGQCLGCVYSQPDQMESDQGPLNIVFSDNRTATLSWEGEMIAIERIAFGWTDVVDKLTGDWLLTFVENGTRTVQVANISGTAESGLATVQNSTTGSQLGMIELLDGDVMLMLDDASEDLLPVVLPESQRFYAGYSDASALQVVGLRLDDMPFAFSEITSVSNSTLGIFCSYSDSTPNNQSSVTVTSVSEWTCTDGVRALSANGIPDHDVGEFPNSANPNTISEHDVTASMTLEPVKSESATELGGPLGNIGYVLNGVKIDAGTGGTCDDSGETCDLGRNVGTWRIEALGQSSFDFGTDANNAHVQPDGQYHYHGIPEGFVAKRGGGSDTMTLIGWAADGFPIYARYGYREADDSTSPLIAMTGSYQLISDVSSSRPSTDLYALGTFAQDWEYVAGSGDLDECNGREGVTPEFPQGIYHYYATDTYPYFQRCVKGEVDAGNGGPPPGP